MTTQNIENINVTAFDNARDTHTAVNGEAPAIAPVLSSFVVTDACAPKSL